MAYTAVNFRTKKALRQALADGEEVRVFQPGPFASTIPANGRVYLEGPHYPEPHRWYASGELKDGVLVSVR